MAVPRSAVWYRECNSLSLQKTTSTVPFTEERVKVAGTELYVLQGGSGTPILVLHGVEGFEALGLAVAARVLPTSLRAISGRVAGIDLAATAGGEDRQRARGPRRLGAAAAEWRRAEESALSRIATKQILRFAQSPP